MSAPWPVGRLDGHRACIHMSIIRPITWNRSYTTVKSPCPGRELLRIIWTGTSFVTTTTRQDWGGVGAGSKRCFCAPSSAHRRNSGTDLDWRASYLGLHSQISPWEPDSRSHDLVKAYKNVTIETIFTNENFLRAFRTISWGAKWAANWICVRVKGQAVYGASHQGTDHQGYGNLWQPRLCQRQTSSNPFQGHRLLSTDGQMA